MYLMLTLFCIAILSMLVSASWAMYSTHFEMDKAEKIFFIGLNISMWCAGIGLISLMLSGMSL